MPLVIAIDGDGEAVLPTFPVEWDIAHHCAVSVAEQSMSRSCPHSVVIAINSPDTLPAKSREWRRLMTEEVDTVTHAAEPYVAETVLENLPHIVCRGTTTTQVWDALRRPSRKIYDPNPTGR